MNSTAALPWLNPAVAVGRDEKLVNVDNESERKLMTYSLWQQAGPLP